MTTNDKITRAWKQFVAESQLPEYIELRAAFERAVATAMDEGSPTPAPEEGWRYVPAVATTEMVDAARMLRYSPAEMYAAMVEQAPLFADAAPAVRTLPAFDAMKPAAWSVLNAQGQVQCVWTDEQEARETNRGRDGMCALFAPSTYLFHEADQFAAAELMNRLENLSVHVAGHADMDLRYVIERGLHAVGIGRTFNPASRFFEGIAALFGVEASRRRGAWAAKFPSDAFSEMPDDGVSKFGVPLSGADLEALSRFIETSSDGEGYDVPVEAMKKLESLGLVRRTSGSRYTTTDFGLAVQARLDKPDVCMVGEVREAEFGPGITPVAPKLWTFLDMRCP